MLTADLYWSFRSPYSYLATRRIVAMEAEYELSIKLRVVHPLAIRAPEFFERSNPLMQAYVAMDTRRVAEYLNIPFMWPQPDPVVTDPTRRKFAVEQPYIFWLSRLGVEATRQGRGLAFANEVSQVLWGGQVRNWHLGEHLAGAASRAKLELSKLESQYLSAGRRPRFRDLRQSSCAYRRRTLGCADTGLSGRAILRAGSVGNLLAPHEAAGPAP